MAKLTIEEKIARIEQAPIEVQAMVAKAFLRSDIKDEDIQYTFNTDTIEELNDVSEDSMIENINAEDPEGIGAGEFFIRTSKPGAGNKNFIRTASGGWSSCIKGNPTDAQCDVLANCVGYASGRFNEIINEVRGTTGCTYKTLTCNAENWIEKAKAAGLKTGSTPRVGAIGCAMKGSTLNSGDGAGHVWIVERVNSNGSTYTSESGYNSNAFWNQTRSNSNGRWGLGSAYSFRAYIYLPDDVQAVVDKITGGNSTQHTTPSADISNKSVDELVREVIAGKYGNGNDRKAALGNRYSEVQARVNEILNGNNSAPAPTPTPQPTGLQVGDRVQIIGTGNGSSLGGSNTAYGIGWNRQILKIWEGRPYPYQVGNGSGTTGFYPASALKKI